MNQKLSHHTFLIEDALAYGLNCAVVLQLLRLWLTHNKATGRNVHEHTDGNEYYWTFNSVKAWQEQLPYISTDTIKRALKKLEDDGVILSGNFNRLKVDRTKWYTMPTYTVCIGADRPMEEADRPTNTKVLSKGIEKEDTDSTSKPLSLGTKPSPPTPPPTPDVQNCTPTPPPPPEPQHPAKRAKPSDKPPKARSGQPRKPSKPRETWLTPFDEAWFARSGGHLPFAQVSRGFKLFIADHGDEALPWWQNFCKKAPRDEFHTVYSFLRNPIPWKPQTKTETQGAPAATKRF